MQCQVMWCQRKWLLNVIQGIFPSLPAFTPRSLPSLWGKWATLSSLPGGIALTQNPENSPWKILFNSFTLTPHPSDKFRVFFLPTDIISPAFTSLSHFTPISRWLSYRTAKLPHALFRARFSSRGICKTTSISRHRKKRNGSSKENERERVGNWKKIDKRWREGVWVVEEVGARWIFSIIRFPPSRSNSCWLEALCGDGKTCKTSDGEKKNHLFLFCFPLLHSLTHSVVMKAKKEKNCY